MSDDISKLFPDRKAMAKSFGAAVETYEEAAVLQREIAKRMVSRLDFIKQVPKRILDLGCGTGFVRELLKERYPKAEIIAADISPAMVFAAQKKNNWLKKKQYPGVCLDATKLPFKEAQFDLVISNLMVQWCENVDDLFMEIRRVTKVDGLFMFTSMGPDTLKELRAAWAEVDDHPHVNVFLDMHDIGDSLTRSQLADPVIDVEDIVLTYSKIKLLFSDLKQIGAHNVSKSRQRTLTGKEKYQKMCAAYESQRTNGVLPATYEVVYGHAWVPNKPITRKYDDGSIGVPVSAIGRR